MTEQYRAIVIGGGIVGCSVLYGLAKLGWTDTLLLERRDLTSGSTWHAAGNTTFFGHYPAITRLFVNSIKTYLEAERESGQTVDFHPAGSLRLATSEVELEGYRRLQPTFDAMQVPYSVVSPKDMEAIHPLLVTDGLYGAAHTPTDGHVDPTGATRAMAKVARAKGATIRRQCPVTEIVRAKNGWSLTTAQGVVEAEHVVLATSFWAREMALPLGLNLPIYALAHHEVITGPVKELEALDFEVPTVRDPDAPSNTRQERNGFLCGVYESNPQFWSVDGIPHDFAEELLPPDMERIEPHLLKVIQRLPSLGDAGIRTVNNGPLCYTPDGCPLLGPVDDYPGLWLATGFNIGIGTGGGSGEFLAKWMVNGEPEVDLPIIYPSRFQNDLGRDRCLEMIRSTYASGYRIAQAT